MAEIKIDIDFDQDLTIFKVSGSLMVVELLESTGNYHQGKATKRVLCDFSDVTWGELTAEGLRKSTRISKQYSTLLKAIDMPLSSPLILISEWVECLLPTPIWRSMLMTLVYFDLSMKR